MLARPRRVPSALAAPVVLAVLAALAPRLARAEPAFTATCDGALRAQQIDDLVARLRAVAGPCRLGRIDTDMFRTVVDWHRDDRTITALLAPRACLDDATHRGRDLALAVPDALARDCPAAHTALVGFVDVDHPLAPVLDHADGWRGEAPVLADPRHVACALALAALLLALAVRRPASPILLPILAPAARAQPSIPHAPPPPSIPHAPTADAPLPTTPSIPDAPPPPSITHPPTNGPLPTPPSIVHPPTADAPLPTTPSIPDSLTTGDSPHASTPLVADARWPLLAAALLLLALAVRFAVVAAPANWYGAFLPHDGWGDLRFGTGAAVLQAGARAVLPWSADLAFALVRVLGALAVPLVVVLVRRLGGPLAAAALAGLLVALAPIPVRLSASSSEHVLAATLALAAWVVWLRAAVDRRLAVRLLAVVLAALAVVTRVDCLPQLAAIPLWTTLAVPPATPSPLLPARRRLRDALGFWLALAVIAAWAWVDLVLPAHHPGPELAAVLQTSQRLLSQFWTVTITPPHWIPAPLLGLAILGLAAAAALRRWRLLLAVLATLALMFLPLGRNLVHDGLTGARYFVLLTPLLAVVAATTIAWLAPRLAPRRLAAALALFALLLAWTSRPAHRHETTFQAEHRLLADALADPRLAGCTLWSVAPRQRDREPDLDCCLDPGRSPLPLRAPAIRFESVPPDRDPDDTTGCHLHYLGAVCDLDPALAPRSPRTASRIREQCDRLRRRAGDRVLFHAAVPLDTVTPRSLVPPTATLTLRDDR